MKINHGNRRRHAGKPARWSGGGLLVGERAAGATPFAAGEEEEQQREDERDRGAEAIELREESGEELVAVAGQQVLGDPEQEPADESDRYRAEATQATAARANRAPPA